MSAEARKLEAERAAEVEPEGEAEAEAEDGFLDVSQVEVGAGVEAGGGGAGAIGGALPSSPGAKKESRYARILRCREDDDLAEALSAADLEFYKEKRQELREDAATEAARLAAENSSAQLAAVSELVRTQHEASQAQQAKFEAQIAVLTKKLAGEVEDLEPTRREFSPLHPENLFAVQGRRNERTREPGLHADYGVQDEPFKILADRFKARTKRSKGTIAAPDDLLQVQIFSELRTVVSTCEHLEDAILQLEAEAPDLLSRVTKSKLTPRDHEFALLDKEAKKDYLVTIQVYNTLVGIMENILRPKMSLLYLYAVLSDQVGIKTHSERVQVAAYLEIAQHRVYGDPFFGELPETFDKLMLESLKTFRDKTGEKLSKAIQASIAATLAGPSRPARSNFAREARRFGASEKSMAGPSTEITVISPSSG